MPTPLRIILTPEEDRTLSELRLAQSLPQLDVSRGRPLYPQGLMGGEC